MADPQHTLQRRLGLISSIAVVIGTTIGSGIFRSPASIAGRLPSGPLIMTVWIVGGVLALCGALSLAEVASVLPRTGGFYAFIREGWGDLPAFLFGWAEFVIIRAAALGAVATTFAEYALRLRGGPPLFGTHDLDVHYVAAVAIVALAGVNIIGVRVSAAVLEATVFFKYGALVFLVVIAFAIHPSAGNVAVAAATPVAATTSISIGAFGLALVSVLWAYDGWGDLTFIGGEVRDPERNLPRALIGGTAAVVFIYLAANAAYLAVIPVAEMPRSSLIAADVAQRLVGSWGVTLVGIAVVISTFGTLTGSLLASPRVFFAMADDGLFFRKIAAVQPRFGTPYVAIALAAALGVAFVLLRTFEQLADAFVTAIIPFYALGVAAVFRLRQRAGYNPPFRVPLYPVLPALFIVAAVYLLGSALVDESSRWATIAVMGVTLVGVPVYYAAFGSRGERGVSGERE